MTASTLKTAAQLAIVNLPKSVIQQSGTDLASFDYQLDLDEP